MSTIRLDHSMSLLVDLFRFPTEPGYDDDHDQPTSTLVKSVALLLAVALGAVTVWCVRGLLAQTSPAEVKAVLVRQITDVFAANDALQAQISAADARIGELSAQGPVAVDPATTRDLIWAGDLPVTGPGITVELGPTASMALDDSDLQVVVNGLWASGAEAIAINGQRISALTAIRSAGQAILVDLVALSPPYRIDVIGDPAALQAAFARTTAAIRLNDLRTNDGLNVQIAAAPSLSLAAAAISTLTSAIQGGQP